MKRLAAWAARLPPQAQDLALALALAAYNVTSLIPEAGRLRLPWLAFALAALQSLPLTWRRRQPLLVWVAIGIPRTLYDELNLGFAPLALASLISYYTVMERCSTRVRLVVSLVMLWGAINLEFEPGHIEPYDSFIAALEFAAVGAAGIISRTRQNYLLEVEARAENAEARDREVALAAARERTRIARELHDVVAHHVSLMAVQSDAAATLLPEHPVQAEKHVEIIGQAAREALAELRQLLGVLRVPAGSAGRQPPDTTPVPSVSQLDKVLAQVREAGIAVDLRVEGSPARLPPGVDLTAYRIVQEALTNTVRHSGADKAVVTLRYEPGFVTVSVTDTGRGLSAWQAAAATAGRQGTPKRSQPHADVTGGFGLAGITERVASCGGSLTVGPGQAAGFAVTARLPTP